jgi:hypothetical protein
VLISKFEERTKLYFTSYRTQEKDTVHSGWGYIAVHYKMVRVTKRYILHNGPCYKIVHIFYKMVQLKNATSNITVRHKVVHVTNWYIYGKVQSIHIIMD